MRGGLDGLVDPDECVTEVLLEERPGGTDAGQTESERLPDRRRGELVRRRERHQHGVTRGEAPEVRERGDRAVRVARDPDACGPRAPGQVEHVHAGRSQAIADGGGVRASGRSRRAAQHGDGGVGRHTERPPPCGSRRQGTVREPILPGEGHVVRGVVAERQAGSDDRLPVCREVDDRGGRTRPDGLETAVAVVGDEVVDRPDDGNVEAREQPGQTPVRTRIATEEVLGPLQVEGVGPAPPESGEAEVRSVRQPGSSRRDTREPLDGVEVLDERAVGGRHRETCAGRQVRAVGVAGDRCRLAPCDRRPEFVDRLRRRRVAEIQEGGVTGADAGERAADDDESCAAAPHELCRDDRLTLCAGRVDDVAVVAVGGPGIEPLPRIRTVPERGSGPTDTAVAVGEDDAPSGSDTSEQTARHAGKSTDGDRPAGRDLDAPRHPLEGTGGPSGGQRPAGRDRPSDVGYGSLVSAAAPPERRVLLVGPMDSPYGAQRSQSVLRRALTDRGVHVEVLLLAAGRPDGHLARTGPVTVVPSTGSVWRDRWTQVRTIRRRARDCDAVVSFGHWANWLVAPAAWRTGAVVAVSERTDPDRPSRRRWNRRLPLYRFADVLVVPTVAMARELEGRRWAPRRVVCIPNALDPSVPAVERVEPRGGVVLAAGRLHPDKAHDVYLRAVARCRPQLSGWRALLVGSGVEERRLRDLIRDLDLDEIVTMEPHTDDLAARMRDADVFVTTSRSETFGNVLIEAMASGCAVVAANCRFGPAEILDPGVTGLLVPIDDVEAVADAIVGLVEDEDRRLAMARAGRTSVERFASGTLADRWLETLGMVP